MTASQYGLNEQAAPVGRTLGAKQPSPSGTEVISRSLVSIALASAMDTERL